MESSSEKGILVAGIIPYFLERPNSWFEENLNKILEAAKTRSFFQENILFINKNSSIGVSQILRKLDELGYEKVFKTENPGEFSQKGGIIEIFPINSSSAIRLDFLGNNIEKIEEFGEEIKDERKIKEILKKRLKSQKTFSDLKDLKSGDYLVHLDHGVGKFTGFEEIRKSIEGNYTFEIEKYYILEYEAGDKLFVPVEIERKLSKYIGFEDPKISRLGSSLWQTTKKKAKEEIEKLAKDLLETYAGRENASRAPYSGEDELDKELAATFKYETTPDQERAIEEIKKDLEKDKPMDRLVCGDVGFGKTEVALRAALKVAKSGYQTAIICPTTILANQHFQNFKERLKNFALRVELLTRLQNRKEQEKIIQDLKDNKIDIIIGTHRLLSKDVSDYLFQKDDKGLLIIDDEQKFGVKQKEKLKQLKNKIDILSLSATPIPRTMHLALSSLRSLSVIQTPPEGRMPIKIFSLPFSKMIVETAIKNEIARGGQVYYLHNRVESMEKIKEFIEELVPGVKVGIIHGKMSENDLIKVLDGFKDREINILLATTIIENGLDFSNANTLIVADATRLGLSQAYQIKGRVGRNKEQAFAYFFHDEKLEGKAKLRLEALQDAEQLGSGYKIALRDMEIRGAGNILGKEQSGSVNKIGLNLYCQLLSEAVDRLRE